MSKKIPALFFFLAFVLCAFTVQADTVVYYNEDPMDENGAEQANMLLNLCRHFDGSVSVKDLAGYSAGEMNAFDHIVYIGTVFHPLPPDFLQDAGSGVRRLLWIGENFNQLSDSFPNPSPLGYRLADYEDGAGLNRLRYKERLFDRDESDLSFYIVETTDQATVYSFITESGESAKSYPDFVCGHDVCYLADNPFYNMFTDDRLLVFADELHEFYQTDAPENHQALIRIEDLAPVATDVSLLREFALQLESLGVPFGFGVTPFFDDPEGIYYPKGSEFTFGDDPEFVDALNFIMAHGGTMIMHGVTHQHDNGISREDWEFVQGENQEPLDCDSEDWARQRIEQGLAEFEKQGWRPMIWETPHYAASEGDYRVFSEYFDNAWERTLVFARPPDEPPVFGQDIPKTEQLIPFYTPGSANGYGILPEILGDFSQGGDTTPEKILEAAEKLSVVRDGVASCFFHHEFTSPEDLAAVVEGLQEQGYVFISAESIVGDDGMNGKDDGDDGDDDDDDSSGSSGGGCGC